LNYLKDVYQNLELREDIKILEDYLKTVYLKQGISNRSLATNLALPIPIVVAIKNEFKKIGFIKQQSGIRLTKLAIEYVEQQLGYHVFENSLVQKIVKNDFSLELDFKFELELLQKIFSQRPAADVTLDQAKATPETSLHRALLAVQNNSLLGKNILCLGDDDLVSICLGMLLKKLSQKVAAKQAKITVLDIDRRILTYITKIADQYQINLTTKEVDLRTKAEVELRHEYDCLFLDPPYTMTGLELFLESGISFLKSAGQQTIFLAMAAKYPEFKLKSQQLFTQLGLVIKEIKPAFNQYEGAEIIAGQSDMIILETTAQSTILNRKLLLAKSKQKAKAIYTGECNIKQRLYQCKTCGQIYLVGSQSKFETITALKKQGCFNCGQHIFDLKRSNLKGDN
jgi:hypothetical protein